jgi:hypothetical protein
MHPAILSSARSVRRRRDGFLSVGLGGRWRWEWHHARTDGLSLQAFNVSSNGIVKLSGNHVNYFRVFGPKQLCAQSLDSFVV